MYIYLDESYNLKDRDKKRFISINGFMVADIKLLFKLWKEYRKPFAEKRQRIHANEKYFESLGKNAISLFEDRTDMLLVSVFQVIQEIPYNSRIYDKGKLDFDTLYYLMLIELFKVMRLDEYRWVKITVDNRKHKGLLGKEKFREDILNFLRKEMDETKFEFFFQPSTTNVLLELADFYSNIFYRAYLNDDKSFLRDCRPRIIVLKNPLSNLTDVLE